MFLQIRMSPFRRFAWLRREDYDPVLEFARACPSTDVSSGAWGRRSEYAIGLTVALLTYPSVLFYPFSYVLFWSRCTQASTSTGITLGYLQWSTIGAIGGVAVYLFNERSLRRSRPN